MKRQLLPLLLAIVLVLCSCTPSRTARKNDEASSIKSSLSETSEAPIDTATKLRIWIIDETPAQLGEYSPLSGSEGNYIETALEKYAAQNNLDLKINYAYTQDSIPGPSDLIVLGDAADLQYRLSAEDYLDLTPYFEQDEIYSSGNYIEPVLKAGIQDDMQFAFPLAFNLSVLYTSQEALDRHQLSIAQGDSFDELVTTFTNEFNNLSRPADEALLMGYAPWPSLSSIYRYFNSASGVAMIDPETNQPVLDLAYFNQLLNLYEAYAYNNFQCDRSFFAQYIDMAFVMTADQSKWHTLNTLADPYNGAGFNGIADQTACFFEIYENYHSNYLQSFVAQAAYYESRYTDLEEEFLCIGVPEKENANSYAANVTLCGLIPANSRYPAESYQLLKALADTPIPWYCGVSANRTNMDAMFETLTTTTIDVQLAGCETELSPYSMKPMSRETADYLRSMIEQIHTAHLPMSYFYTDLDETLSSYLADADMTEDEIYTKVLKALEWYIMLS